MANNNMFRANKPWANGSITPALYGECMRNQLADSMTYATDGCHGFGPGGPPGSIGAMRCQTCGCHRNFHRRLDTGNHQIPPPSHPRRQIYGGTRLGYYPPTIILLQPPPPATRPNAPPPTNLTMGEANTNANSLTHSFRVSTGLENISSTSLNLPCVHPPFTCTGGSTKGKEKMDERTLRRLASNKSPLPPLPQSAPLGVYHRRGRDLIRARIAAKINNGEGSSRKRNFYSRGYYLREEMRERVRLLSKQLEWLNVKNKLKGKNLKHESSSDKNESDDDESHSDSDS